MSEGGHTIKLQSTGTTVVILFHFCFCFSPRASPAVNSSRGIGSLSYILKYILSIFEQF